MASRDLSYLVRRRCHVLDSQGQVDEDNPTQPARVGPTPQEVFTCFMQSRFRQLLGKQLFPKSEIDMRMEWEKG